ncbi:TPA: helix-turn-helix transcriptional regulator [Candidatus Bathyarchaeota archaeon]|nr:helix-turn-helix transcriptional regulator [Candidatus Bathyarchaeota archaeon]HIJ08992.1 helix-turn-helix transcriptional regulator [Candidatus Bathyarchaeota archaeon]
MSEAFRKEIVQRITKNLTDIQILRLLQAQPLWGYRIKKRVETDVGLRLRHGTLYPTLNLLEKRGFVTSQRQQKDGRARKVYTITEEGKQYLESYYSIIREHLETPKGI